MTTPLTHPERVAVARLHALLELLPTALDQRLAPLGVTSFEHTVLETLAESPEQRARMSLLARRTNATRPRLSRVAASLERRGLIERAPCELDGRATNAILTARGGETLARSRDAYAAAVRELVLTGLTGLPGDGVAQLATTSYAILTSLDERAAADAGAAAGTGQGACAADPAPAACAADPAPTPKAVPGTSPAAACAADPVAVPAAPTVR
ncbi:MarR family winged helix-turn-helix transcriptional regulator [Leucobacter luti]|uniref:DNA-binding MarR family transcriptional regulator n=1 Tax=Leucobacter luti TaxID=340320 RepID=A0A4Q7U5I6_9MICO|nr:MarR family transcriptional regulator [Leucobacter luti]MBL3700756.1 MarR family transcriptional regulator [Leucobacter luti]RZT68407.1 DNA-binding MarR family transcriptional regulator [Leucobacter luti]